MKNKCVWVAILMAAVTVFGGCNQGTSGGPGAASPPVTERMGQTDDTFSLDLPSLSLNQGETKTVSVDIKRGDNFSEDVSLKLSGLPTGVTFTPADPSIARGDTDMDLVVTATNDAALGDFTVKVTGHPTKGADAITEMKISVKKLNTADTRNNANAANADANAANAANNANAANANAANAANNANAANANAANAANNAADAATVKWNEYTATMQAQMDQFSVKYAELQDRAAKATGDAKAEADQMVAAAKVKMDAASVKMTELKAAGADRWEKIKDGVGLAFEDLKTAFE